jgi:hypothetical protein
MKLALNEFMDFFAGWFCCFDFVFAKKRMEEGRIGGVEEWRSGGVDWTNLFSDVHKFSFAYCSF